MKKIVPIILTTLLAILFMPISFGAVLQLNRIGGLDLGGKNYSEWWYTGTFPTFYGKAATSAEVTIKVNDTSNKVTSGADGNWSYNAPLDKGDYKVSISQGSEMLSFTLHLGQNMPSNVGTTQSSQSSSAVPVTGYNQIVALAFGAGVLLLASYLYITGDPTRKSVFETRIIKED